MVDNRIVDKPGTLVDTTAAIVIRGSDQPFVSRGGLKLDGALKALEWKIDDLICIDIGASTGGFTDCLLQRGAKKVYAVDVGYGQLAWKLRQDERVIPVERTNFRRISDNLIPEFADLITIDVSFISLKLILPPALRFLKPSGRILALIKPQFEVGRGKVGKGGIVRQPELHQDVIDDLCGFAHHLGLACGPVIVSSIVGAKGNQEFLWPLMRSDP